MQRGGRVNYGPWSRETPPPSGPGSVSTVLIEDWLLALRTARFFQQHSSKSAVYPDKLSCFLDLDGPHRQHSLKLTAGSLPPDPAIQRVFEEVYSLYPRTGR